MTNDKTTETPLLIPARQAHVGGPQIRRLLPWSQKRMVGPFIFLDHFPSTPFAAGESFNVRPHPHIGLSTLSYLIEGSILHHDSLGYKQVLKPGDVNWMTAGKGISHSEKTPDELKSKDYRLHLLQFWVALPLEFEKVAPSFTHHPANTIPEINTADQKIRIVAGSYAGQKSPVHNYSPLHFVDVQLQAGADCEAIVPGSDSAFYVLKGEVEWTQNNKSMTAKAGDCYFLGHSGQAKLKATTTTQLVLFGGHSFPEERIIEWNFVGSSRELINNAKAAWKDGSFPQVPGEPDIIPLP